MLLLLLISALLVVAFRLPKTIEYRVLRGTPEQRAELCRSLPEISSRRQAWALHRLLRDEVDEVRSSAITAVQRGAHSEESIPLILAMAQDSTESPIVRSKAGHYLLDQDHDGFRRYLEAEVQNREFRANLPELSAACLVASIQTASPEERQRLVEMALDPDEPAGHELAEAIKNHASLFQDNREWLVDQLDHASSPSQRRLILQALQGFDGKLRGASSLDWRVEAVKPSQQIEGHVIEAEWAAEIQPNYQIEEHNGVRCLGLGEGSGGLIQWLKGYQGTVDIASARFSFHAPSTGVYNVWARVYLDDKCGNSFGFYLNNLHLTNFPDGLNVMGAWHWLPLLLNDTPDITLEEGFQQVRLEAWEDAVYIDKFALLKPGVSPETCNDDAMEYWDPRQLSGISFSCFQQGQPRGTRQLVTVWVRRNSPAMQSGTVALRVPPGFRLLSPSPTTITFSPGNPLARSTFELEFPADAVAGEGLLEATYTETSDHPEQPPVEGEFVLGGQYDWSTSGPLPEHSARAIQLLETHNLTDRELAEGWTRFPLKGYDRYRRLNPEYAWGQLSGAYIYFCTDIEVTEAGAYLALLTADDNAAVWVDGVPLITQPKNGPGEGRMVTQKATLKAGRHRLFARLYQKDFADPVGPDATRHTENRCCFKLLLRQSRYVPAPQIKGLPWK